MRMDSRVDLNGAALAAGVAEGTVKNWIYRGWLDAAGKRHRLEPDTEGKVLVGDVLRAERDTRRKRGRCHRRLPPPDAYHKVA